MSGLNLRVVHCLGWYFPESSGGTEVYVDGLARSLLTRGVDCVVAAAADGREPRSYRHNGVPVWRYPVFPEPSARQIRGEQPHGGFEIFQRWLKECGADVYHQHSWTMGCGHHHLEWARRLGMRTVLTVHVPSAICLRGTMLLHGGEPCDGLVQEGRCGSCWGAASGLPGALAAAAARIPEWVGRRALEWLPPSPLATALGRRQLVAAHRARLLSAVGRADRVVAVCDWLLEALRKNGVPEQKLAICRQGVADAEAYRPGPGPSGNPVPRIGFLGRWDQAKGLTTLVRAVRRVDRQVKFELVVHAMGTGEAGQRLRNETIAEAAADPRIRFEPPLERSGVPNALSGFDLLAVPSVGLETGPFVVLEAHAAGVPVLGSDRGGIRELVRHGVNGWLAPAGDEAAWSRAIRELVENPGTLTQLRSGIGRVRTMDSAAQESAALYRSLFKTPHQRQPGHSVV